MENNDIKITSYVTNYQPYTMVSKLTKLNPDPSDQGNYECRVSSNSLSKSAFFEVETKSDEFRDLSPSSFINYYKKKFLLIFSFFCLDCNFNNETSCRNGACIPRNFVCDGKIDCSDSTDEVNCDISSKKI